MEDVEEAYYDCIRGLDERIPDCKLAMHANCFGEIQRSLIHDFGCRHNGGSNRLERLKSHCHHSLRDLCVHIDGAWLKLKKIATKKMLVTIKLDVSFV